MKKYQNTFISRRRILQLTVGAGATIATGTIATEPVVAAGGDLVWRYGTQGEVSSSPTVVDNTVYVGSSDGNVYAIAADTGNEQWRFNASSAIESSPADADDAVVVGSESGSVYALDATTGTERWRFETGGLDNSVGPTVGNNTVYIGSSDGNVYALDVSNGDEQWRFDSESGIYGSPTVANGTVYVGSDTQFFALEAATGDQQWQSSAGDSIYDSPAVADGTVFFGAAAFDSGVYALETATGDQKWRFETGDGISSSPTVADGTVFVASSDQNLYAIDAATGDEQWQFETDGTVYAAPAVVGGTVYVGSRDQSVYALAAVSGDVQWQFETDGNILSSPAVVSNTVFIGSNDGNVYALDAGLDSSTDESGSQPSNSNSGTEELSAEFRVETSPVQTDIDIEFDASESTGDIRTYEWDFDNTGTFTTTGQVVSQTFSQPRLQTVALRVTDENGDSRTTRQELTIQPSRSDIEISITNNFVGESGPTVWDMLYNEARETFSPGIGDGEPNEQEAYINVDIEIVIPNAQELGINTIVPTFESPQWDAPFGPDMVEIPRTGEDVFNKTILISTVGQMGLQLLETLTTALSAVGRSTGEISSAVESRTENYPDVYLRQLALEYDQDVVQDIAVDRRIPRYIDTCPENKLASVLSPQQCNLENYSQSDVENANGVIALSPVSICVRDANDRKVGRVQTTNGWETVNEIPNAIYSGPLRHEFIVIPGDLDYSVEATGTDTGTVTLIFDSIDGSGQPSVTTHEYQDVRVTSGSLIQSSFDETTIQIDENGDGSVDQEREAQTTSRSTSEYLNSRVQAVESSGISESEPSSRTPFGYTIEEIAVGGAVTAGLAYLAARLLNTKSEP